MFLDRKPPEVSGCPAGVAASMVGEIGSFVDSSGMLVGIIGHGCRVGVGGIGCRRVDSIVLSGNSQTALGQTIFN